MSLTIRVLIGLAAGFLLGLALGGSASICTVSVAVAEPPAATLTDVSEGATNPSVALPDAAATSTNATVAITAIAKRPPALLRMPHTPL